MSKTAEPFWHFMIRACIARFTVNIMGKSKRTVTNWKQYNQALVNRGSITFWLDKATQHGVVDQIIRLNATAPRLSAALRDFLA
ncbi:hypothetical protein AAEH84_13975, partial [Shewanella indica]